MGRPCEFTQATADEICERIADGESLRRICADDHMPGKGAVLRWLAAFDSFRTQYALAREEQAETHGDDMTDIADEPPPLDQYGKVDAGAVQHQRLRIETRKWIAAKLKPKKYGDKIGVEHSGHIEQLSDEQIEAKIAALSASAGDGSA